MIRAENLNEVQEMIPNTDPGRDMIPNTDPDRTVSGENAPCDIFCHSLTLNVS